MNVFIISIVILNCCLQFDHFNERNLDTAHVTS